jgi:hypothetical protein
MPDKAGFSGQGGSATGLLLPSANPTIQQGVPKMSRSGFCPGTGTRRAAVARIPHIAEIRYFGGRDVIGRSRVAGLNADPSPVLPCFPEDFAMLLLKDIKKQYRQPNGEILPILDIR